MQTAAPQGAIGATILSYSENGGALSSGLPFPDPPNTVSNRTRRHLLQAASATTHADSNMQILCQGCGDTSAMFAALNSSEPSQIFSASGETLPLGV